MKFYKRHAPLTVIAASLLLIGAGCFGSTTVKTNLTPATETAPDTDVKGGPSDAMRVRGNVIIIPDQKPGSTLKVSAIDVDKPSFIVLRESSEANGKILGVSALLEVGESSPTITLSRETIEMEPLTAWVYADDGDGKYGSEDEFLKDYQGNPMWSAVIIDANASEGSNPVL